MRDRSQSSPTGSEIFAKAVQTWSALPTPTYLSYAVVVTIERHGRAHVDRQRVVFRTVDRVGIAQDASGAVTFGRPRYVPDVAFRLVPRDARDFDDAQGDAKRYAIELAEPNASTTATSIICASSRSSIRGATASARCGSIRKPSRRGS